MLYSGTGPESCMAHVRPKIGSSAHKIPQNGVEGNTERGTTREEDAQGTPTQRHISPSILAFEDQS